MARSYTSRSTAIWREDEFRALTAEQQHLLFLIESQPDISAAGTLPLTLRRWAAMFLGGTVEGVRKTLAGLEAAGRVVVDEDTDELLLCTFIADDRGYVNKKRRPVILRAAGETNSMELRRALAREFGRLGLPTDVLSLPPNPGGPTPSDRTDDPEPEPGEADGTGDQGEPDPPVVADEKPQANRASDRASDRASRFKGDVVCTGREVDTPLHNPHLSSRTPAPNAQGGPLRFVAGALGIEDDETREVIDQIRRLHKPRNLSGYIRTMAANGDLSEVLDEVRRTQARKASAAARQAARASMPDPAAEPPPTSATPEEAAAAKAALRELLAGRKTERGGDPARLGALLPKAASA